ncbi:MAG: phage major capsid protein, partial [Acidothermus sp.]|nr:phage major capsid protein [Acidothermus sp.]
ASSNSSDSLLAAITAASAEIQTSVFLTPDAIIMHPRRWSWILASVDTTNRPLVAPSAGFNTVGEMAGVAAQGRVGTLAGLPVYCDPQIPTDRGAGQNEDVIIVAKADEAYLWESTPTLSVFDAPYADSMGVLIRAHEYVALIPNRRPKAFSVISGSGLVAPTV